MIILQQKFISLESKRSDIFEWTIARARIKASDRGIQKQRVLYVGSIIKWRARESFVRDRDVIAAISVRVLGFIRLLIIRRWLMKYSGYWLRLSSKECQWLNKRSFRRVSRWYARWTCTKLILIKSLAFVIGSFVHAGEIIAADFAGNSSNYGISFISMIWTRYNGLVLKYALVQ